jgi:hypothetical protein
LIAENRLDKVHHRLSRSPFRNGMLCQQFSLSDYFAALRTVRGGGERGVEGVIYAPIRCFDETALVLPSGRSVIGELMTIADRILIEDLELTASRLKRHIGLFGLTDLSVTDLSDRRAGHGASVLVIGRRPLPNARLTAVPAGNPGLAAAHQQ